MKIKNIIIALSTLLITTSCGDFLEEYSQDHDYVRSWNDLNELLIGDCYMPVNMGTTFQNHSNAGMFLHLFSDEVDDHATKNGGSFLGYGIRHEYFGKMTWQDRLGANEDFTTFYTENTTWTAMYKYINVANNILASAEKVPQSKDEEIAGVNYVKGQAHFLRAFYYFWLTNVYGQPYDPNTAATALAVPLKTSKEVEDIKFKRNTVEECYKQIVEDLQAAEKELHAAGSIKRKSIYRADSISAQMLLGRVYLYMQDWDKAITYAQKVIKVRSQLQDLNSVKTKFATTDNPETIFSMGGDDLPNMLYNGRMGITLTKSLYNSYASNDLRKTQWYWAYGDFVGCTKAPETQQAKATNDAYYYDFNYAATIRPISSLFWLRSGEAYLNLAEALAYSGNEEDARKTINELRKNRYATNANDKEITSTGSQLITDIRNERKKELACEGQRWFDLRRYRVCKVQPEKISITHYFSIYESDTDDKSAIETRKYVLGEDDPSWTAPIPYEVLDFNTGMESNGNVRRSYETVETVK